MSREVLLFAGARKACSSRRLWSHWPSRPRTGSKSSVDAPVFARRSGSVAKRRDEQRIGLDPVLGDVEGLALGGSEVLSRVRHLVPVEGDEEGERHGRLLDRRDRRLRHSQPAARLRPDGRPVQEQDPEAADRRGDLAGPAPTRSPASWSTRAPTDRASDVESTSALPTSVAATTTR